MKKAAKRILPVFLILLILLLLTSLPLIFYARHILKTELAWPELLADVQLEPTRPILRDKDITKDNAFFYIRQMDNRDKDLGVKAKEEYDKFIAYGWKADKYSLVKKWLDENSRELDLCRKSAEIQKCQVVTADSFKTSLPYLSPVRDKVKALCFRAEKNAAQENWQSVLKDYRTTLILSDHLSRGGCLINHLVDIAGTYITCQSIRKAALRHNIPEDILRSIILLLDQIDEKKESFAEPMRYERLLALNCAKMIYAPAFKNDSASDTDIKELDLFIKALGSLLDTHHPILNLKIIKSKNRLTFLGSTPENTEQNFNAIYSHIIDIASGPYSPERFQSEIISFTDNYENHEFLKFISEDPIGRILIIMLVPALDKAQANYYRHTANLRGTQIFLAVRLYQEEHNGNLPPSLSDLCPDYISKIPEDPFSKNHDSFKYVVQDNNTWKIYSVGANQIDNGGQYNYLIPSQRAKHEDKIDVCFSSGELIIWQEEYEGRI